jgi:DNA-binding SARP family transcriptional activator
MEFRMLGPLEVLVDGVAVTLGGPKQRATLGFLLLQANRVVAVSELQDALWAYDEAPPTARKVLQNAVWGLRGLFPAEDGAEAAQSAKLVTQPPGYMLRVRPEQVDWCQFQRKVEQGRAQLAARAPERAVRLLGDALALWRGPALADLVEAGIAWPGLAAVQSAKLDVMEDYFEAQLACGRHHEVLGELSAMVSSEPFRERLCGQLMLALYRCGRQVEALDAYSHLRSVLARDLGLEPSPELRSLQRAILIHEPGLTPEELPELTEPRAETRIEARAARGTEPGLDTSTDPRLDLSTESRTEPRSEPRLESRGESRLASPARHGEEGSVLLAPPATPALPDVGGVALPVAGQVKAGNADSGQVAVPDTGGRLVSPARPAERSRASRRDVSIVLVRSHLGDLAEQWDGLRIDDALEHVAGAVQDKVEQLGGVVTMSIGPLSLAVFGLAGSDGCEESAVKAAVAIRDHTTTTTSAGLGSPGPGRAVPTVSLAVATGEALVRPGQHEHGTAPSVFGALVERGQVLLSSAPVGQIVVCDRTRRASEATIAYQPLGQSLDNWQVEGLRETARQEPVAGYEAELTLAQGLLEWSWHRRTTHMITLLGAADTGKTRFLQQFSAALARRPQPVRVLVGRVPPTAGTDAMPVLRHLLAQLCGISPQDPPATAYGRLATALHRWCDTEAERQWLGARLGILFGLKSADGSALDTSEVLTACERFLTALARREPLVLVLDDVHRAHDDVLDFVESLADLPVAVPLFVIVAGRPELLQRRPEWAGGKRRTTTLTLTDTAAGDRRAEDGWPVSRPGWGAVRDVFPTAGGDTLLARPVISSCPGGNRLPRP